MSLHDGKDNGSADERRANASHEDDSVQGPVFDMQNHAEPKNLSRELPSEAGYLLDLEKHQAGEQAQLVLDGTLRIVIANPAYYEMFGGQRDEVERRSLFEICGGSWNLPTLRAWLEELVLNDQLHKDFRIELAMPSGKSKVFRLDAKRVTRRGDDPTLIHLTIEDVASPGGLAKSQAQLAPQHRTLKNRQQVYVTACEPPQLRTLDNKKATEAASIPDTAALFKALRRRWTLALPAGLVAALVVGLATWFLHPPSMYTSQAILQVSAHAPKILFETARSRSDYGIYQRTQVALIRSRLVLKRVLNRPEIAELEMVRRQYDPLGWLEKELKADFSSGSEILRLSLSGDSPIELAALLNVLVEEYLEEIKGQEDRDWEDRLLTLKETQVRYQDAKEARRREMEKLANEVGSEDRVVIALRQQFDVERLAMVQRELLALQSQQRKSRVELDVAQRAAEAVVLGDSSLLDQAIEEQLSQDETIKQLVSRIDAMEKQVFRLRQVSRKESDPSLRRVLVELDAERQELAERREQRMRSIHEQWSNPNEEATAQRIDQLRHLVALQAEHELALRQESDELSAATRSLNRGSMNIATTRVEVDYLSEVASKIRAEIEAAQVERQAPPRVRLLEPADVPLTKDLKPQIKMTGIAGLGAFACLVMGLTYREARIGRVDSKEAVTQELGVGVLGTLPKLDTRSLRQPLLDKAARQSRRSRIYREAIDSTRILLLRTLERDNLQVVLLTSPLKGEGKTSLACHLAASLARSGRSTLLIDGDLQRPTAHQNYALPRGPGFAELLRGEAEIKGVIQKTPLASLAFLPAGYTDEAALNALARGDANRLILEMRGLYDVILIDSSPVVPIADALLLGQYADAALLSVLKDFSCLPPLRVACERLATVGIPIIGAVISKMTEVCYRYSDYDRRRRPNPRVPDQVGRNEAITTTTI